MFSNMNSQLFIKTPSAPPLSHVFYYRQGPSIFIYKTKSGDRIHVPRQGFSYSGQEKNGPTVSKRGFGKFDMNFELEIIVFWFFELKKLTQRTFNEVKIIRMY